MRVMLPSPQRALEHDADVVLARRVGLELPEARHPRPLAEEIDVARVVHLIDEVRAARAAADLAEHGLALRREVPLHVREAVAHAERAEHLAAERDARLRASACCMSRTVMMTGLIHSTLRISSGFGRYAATFS